MIAAWIVEIVLMQVGAAVGMATSEEDETGAYVLLESDESVNC